MNPADHKVICPACKREGQLSMVSCGPTISTSVHAPGYYDENGVWTQPPDPNTHTTRYRCSNGHFFEISRKAGREDKVVEKPYGIQTGRGVQEDNPF